MIMSWANDKSQVRNDKCNVSKGRMRWRGSEIMASGLERDELRVGIEGAR